MCGRVVQKSGPLDYVEQIFTNQGKIFADPAGPRFSIPPGTRPLTLHRLSGADELDRQFWTYRPQGSKYKMNCARLDKVLAGGRPWKMLVGSGRILVPADGWYEWKALGTGPKPPNSPTTSMVKDRYFLRVSPPGGPATKRMKPTVSPS